MSSYTEAPASQVPDISRDKVRFAAGTNSTSQCIRRGFMCPNTARSGDGAGGPVDCSRSRVHADRLHFHLSFRLWGSQQQEKKAGQPLDWVSNVLPQT